MAVSSKFGGSGGVASPFTGSASCGVRLVGSGRITPSLRRITLDYVVDAVGSLSVSGSSLVRLGLNANGLGRFGVTGIASLKQGFNFLPSGRLMLSGLADASQGSSWQLIDTFTGADHTALNGTTCDTGQTRITQILDAEILSNRCHFPFSWIHYSPLTTQPIRLMWDYDSNGVFVDGYFNWDGALGSSTGYFVRVSNGDTTIYRQANLVSWTTGTPTGVGITGTVTITLTSDTITANINGHILTYFDSGGLVNNTLKIVGLGSNGGYADSFYVQ